MGKRIVITGGNTGGHVIPAVPVIKALQGEGWTVMYIGSAHGVEERVAEQLGIPFYSVPAGKWRRYRDWRNITDAAFTLLGVVRALRILLSSRPDIVFSKGGFVSVPVILAARFIGIPVVAHESDVTLSLTSRLAAPLARVFCCGQRETVRRYGRKNMRYTGVPLRPELAVGDSSRGRQLAQTPENRRMLLIFFGSIGATSLNKIVRDQIARLTAQWHVVHMTGKSNGIPGIDNPNYVQIEELYEGFEHLLAASTAVLSRAGATTLAELAFLGKPAILIPLPKTASRGEQSDNAEVYAREHPSIVVPDLANVDIATILDELLDKCGTSEHPLNNVSDSTNEVMAAILDAAR